MDTRPGAREVRLADGFAICDSGLKLLTLWNGPISKWSYFQKSLRSFIVVVLHVNILTAPFAKIGSGRAGWVISQAWFSPCLSGSADRSLPSSCTQEVAEWPLLLRTYYSLPSHPDVSEAGETNNNHNNKIILALCNTEIPLVLIFVPRSVGCLVELNRDME